MKVFDIFGFFLTVGILGFAVAEALQHRPGDGMMLNTLMLKFAEQLCIKNGGPKAVEALDESLKALNQCVTNMTMKLNKMEEETVRSSGKVDPQVPLFCKQLPDLKECLESHLQSVKACEGPAEKKFSDIALKIIYKFVDFACNNAEKINKLRDNGSAKCLVSKYKDLLICTEDFVNYLTATVIKYTFGQIHGGQGALVPLQIGSSCSLDGCQMLESHQTCSIKALNECEDKLPAEVLVSLFEDLNPHIPCKNLIKSRPL